MTNGKASAIVLLSLGFGVMDCMLPSAWAICLDTGGACAGAVSGAMNMAGSAGGFVCTVALHRYLFQWTAQVPVDHLRAFSVLVSFHTR